MGSYYQPVQYLKGGKSRKTTRGGFYPSIMGSVARKGVYLVPIALKHGMKLLNKIRSGTKKKNSKKSKSKKTLRKKNK